jgi:prephenate dehydrogenase
LVRLLDVLNTFHVEQEDVVPRHSTEEGFSITFAVPAMRAGQIVMELSRAGWNAEFVDPVSGARKAEVCF